jgi:FtsH-binding integral membrane protein
MSGVMSAFSMGMLVLVILGLFFGGGGLISGLLVLCFGVFLVYDTQLIMGKGEMALSSDDYIIGALIIYIDVIAIFT